MQRILTVAVLSILLISGVALAKETVYGKGVSEGDFTPISTILADPESYAGKVVRVEGTAVGVCANRGCFVSLASDKEGETMRIRVKEGVIVFPKEIVGEHVKVEGVFNINKKTIPCDATRKDEPEVLCQTLLEVFGSGAVVDWK